jgi:hypothetical protein
MPPTGVGSELSRTVGWIAANETRPAPQRAGGAGR